MNANTDTIAAIGTAPGESAIAIVRVSGPESLTIADRVCRCGGGKPSLRCGNTFVHARVESVDGWADEVILLIYKAPHSYTREDAVEIQGHGGTTAAKRILRAVLDAGARLAEPGEFTKRAFLNGRIDLLQAEAVLDLIRARSDRAAAAALEQLGGQLSGLFDDAYGIIMDAAADLEASLDFSDDELPLPLYLPAVVKRLKEGEARLKRILATWDEGHRLREGALIVISGRPNVGKSTLLNVMLGMNRAIVTPIAGTTRDTIEEHAVINGFPVRIVDTAGLRDANCEIEGEGIRRAREAIRQADIILYIVDGSEPNNDDDMRELGMLPAQKTVVIVNKCDLKSKVNVAAFAADRSVTNVSLLTGIGVESIRSAIITKLGSAPSVVPHATISERHRRLVIMALKNLVDAILLAERADPSPALSASKLRSCLENLGEITGRVYHDQLLQSVFARFCIGK